MSNDDDSKTVVLKRKLAPSPEAPVSDSSVPRVKLRCLDDTYLSNGQVLEIKLHGSEQTVGRSQENSIRIDAKGVSRKHARIFLEGDSWAIEDLRSKNGIHVNKKRVSRAVLKPGDRIDIDPIPFFFVLDKEKKEEVAADGQEAFEQTVLLGKGAENSRVGSSVEETSPMESVRRPRNGHGLRWTIVIGIVVFVVLLFVIST